MPETRDVRIARLRYRAQRRGFKEADLVIGGFAHARLPAMTEAEMDAFEALLDESDQDIYGWVMGTAAAPGRIDAALVTAMRAFAAQGGPARERD